MTPSDHCAAGSSGAQSGSLARGHVGLTPPRAIVAAGHGNIALPDEATAPNDDP